MPAQAGLVQAAGKPVAGVAPGPLDAPAAVGSSTTPTRTAAAISPAGMARAVAWSDTASPVRDWRRPASPRDGPPV
ncbi:hypothetical protein RADP37_05028 [Roseomonas mucosa]|uniref:Uncharacterized protein n=1 Tax=Roseomonas mucosa TaxID=207340 RepID=A0A4Y1N3F4_9PROT|nr:hypothetical protein RADP37_05028 [Roseomonas mucosa]